MSKNDNSKLVGIKLKSLRTSRNMTQRELAIKLGITNQKLSNWERGYSEITVVEIIALLNVLEATETEKLFILE